MGHRLHHGHPRRHKLPRPGKHRSPHTLMGHRAAQSVLGRAWRLGDRDQLVTHGADVQLDRCARLVTSHLARKPTHGDLRHVGPVLPHSLRHDPGPIISQTLPELRLASLSVALHQHVAVAGHGHCGQISANLMSHAGVGKLSSRNVVGSPRNKSNRSQQVHVQVAVAEFYLHIATCFNDVQGVAYFWGQDIGGGGLHSCTNLERLNLCEQSLKSPLCYFPPLILAVKAPL
mmetsp:Transcript_27331/g.65891  ORF Transcript_27331/g.65891 Transcript_27331/m.65891 type:complete len:231 (+) Transcript_27331:116-808(+)